MQDRYIISCVYLLGEKIYYVNDTLVAEDEPYEVVCEAPKDYAVMICDLLNKER